MGHPVPFYLFSALAVAGALGVVLARHPIYAVLSLVLTLFSLAGLFALLNAFFLAAIQILLYAGAILVLFLFVVMLLDMAPERRMIGRGGFLLLAGLGFGGLFLSELVRVALQPSAQARPAGSAAIGTTAAIGKLLFTTYSLPFEVASLLLLAGIVGAVVLAKKKLS